MKPNVNLRISQGNRQLLKSLKEQFNCTTYDDVITLLLKIHNKDISSVVNTNEQEIRIKEVEKNIYSRVESIHKQLSKFSKIYFDKILHIERFNEDFSQEVLLSFHRLSDLKSNIKDDFLEDNDLPKENNNFIKKIETLEKRNSELSKDIDQKMNEIIELNQKIDAIKSLFQKKSSAFTSIYEAKVNNSEFDNLFK